MKTYKQLIESIVSALPRTYTGHVQDGPTNSDSDGNFQDIENPEIADRINAALAHLNQYPTSNPKQRIAEIKVALSHAGVDFDHTSVGISEDEPSEVTAKRWGGRLGMDEDGNWINDDGFGSNPHVIRFEWTKNDHMWHLDAQMKPSVLGEQAGYVVKDPEWEPNTPRPVIPFEPIPGYDPTEYEIDPTDIDPGDVTPVDPDDFPYPQYERPPKKPYVPPEPDDDWQDFPGNFLYRWFKRKPYRKNPDWYWR